MKRTPDIERYTWVDESDGDIHIARLASGMYRICHNGSFTEIFKTLAEAKAYKEGHMCGEQDARHSVLRALGFSFQEASEHA